MIDIINYQIYGFPVLMYGMMAITAGGLTYATVSASGMATAESAAVPAVPGIMPPALTPPASAPASAPIVGGKRKSLKSKRKHTGTAKKNA